MRSRAHPEDVPPPPDGVLRITLKLKVTEAHRRAIAARLGLDFPMANGRTVTITLERVLGKYLEALERDAFAADLLAFLEMVDDG